MEPTLTFSRRPILFVFGAIGLLVSVLAMTLAQARSAGAQQGAITADEAKAIVATTYPEATVVEVERDDSGRNAFEVELDNGVEVLVDAATGQVVAGGTEAGDDGEDADDDGAPEDEPQAAVAPESLGGGFCSATAAVQFDACESQVSDDFLTASAVCIQILDPSERAHCFVDARMARQEGNQLCEDQRDAREDVCAALGEERYDPNFDPALFDDDFTNLTDPNPYFPLAIGNVWEYVGGDETVTVKVLDKTKLIEGVICIVVNDRVEASGQLIEDTDDWYGQRKNSTVDYCGEVARNYELFEGDDPPEPELVNIDGSWKAGRGALPGTLFPGSPAVGLLYRQEWRPGVAEDVATVLATSYGYGSDPELDQGVPQALAELLCAADDCVVTHEFTPIEPDPDVQTRKYYAPGIGLFLEVTLSPEGIEVVQLSSCNFHPICASLPAP